MALSSDLISQLVKTNKTPKKSSEATVTGTVKVDGITYVKLDGSDLLTPVSTTSSVKDGDRVNVLIKDHTATVTGNLSDPSASGTVVETQGRQIAEFGTVLADKISTKELEAEKARIDKLEATDVTISGKLTAAEAEIESLKAIDVEVTGKLTAAEAEIEDLSANKLDAETAEITYATIKSLEATDAKIYNLEGVYGEFVDLTTDRFAAIDADIKDLEAGKLSAASAEILYANIDFANIGEAAFRKIFSESGLIKDLVVGDTTITGELVGVTLKGDLVEAGTLKADRLVVKGSDGIYYKLNFEAGTFTDGEAVPTDSLHGSVITAKSITAEKVSVKDLVAFGATIGGFTIKDHSLYSGVKDSATNTTRGVFLGDDGQVAFGDSSNFLKYYKDANGKYKLEISADSLLIGANNRNIDDIVSEQVSNISIGAVNLVRNSETLLFEDYYFTGDFIVTHDGNGNVTVTCGASVSEDGHGNLIMQSATTTNHDGAGNVTTI